MMWLLFEKLVDEVFKIAAWLTDHSSRELRELSGQPAVVLNRDTKAKQQSMSTELEAVWLIVGLNRDTRGRRILVVQLVVH